MTDAGGTTTFTQVSNEGQFSTYIVHNTSVDSTETIPVDVSGSPVAAEDRVIILGVSNFTSETSGAGTALSAEYDETARHFTITESGVTDESIAVLFMHIPASNPTLGTA